MKVETWDVELRCGGYVHFERVTAVVNWFGRIDAEVKAIKRVEARSGKGAFALNARFVCEGFSCDRCSECVGEAHHWLDGDVELDAKTGAPIDRAEFGFKHCAALGAENDEGRIVVVGVR